MMDDITYHGCDKKILKCFIKLKISMYHVHVIDYAFHISQMGYCEVKLLSAVQQTVNDIVCIEVNIIK